MQEAKTFFIFKLLKIATLHTKQIYSFFNKAFFAPKSHIYLAHI